MVKKIIGIIIIIIGVILPTYLSIVKVISETQFGLILIGFIIVGSLIYKLDEIVEFEIKGLRLKTLQKEIFAKAEEVKRISDDLEKDKGELREATRVFIESFYLTLQTRNIYPIPVQIAKQIENNLNTLANFAVEDEKKRKKWINEIGSLLTQNLPK